ncbi:DNA-binding protein [Pseudoflavonifractor phocaeensis]|uniref:YlxM family DNA-binding protein n=1 Tax=Pseudoflavonifractor phocaeensis TaxID=1870988 RepID=UPI00195EC736|nr:sigma factor-like helix-turn-helix DNA-binding protein [Pseudoflavonifractor phocaeensis]MBM6870670.1 DNA-binding protein [Pseudoflavonifractor phocaeensis]MBM6939227.1 DNA-binding protein [Pseudoflavonifractor phocaeensis]
MKNQAYRMALLYDFYGDMLTDRQKEFYDLYYNEDLSLAEIAENYGITRQGVRDVIVRAEGILTELEEKTGIIRRFHQMQSQYADIQAAVDDIRRINEEKRYYDNQLESRCNDIQHILDQLRQE